jgi:hypothetical protein
MRDTAVFVTYLVWAMESRGVMNTQAIYRGVKSYCERFSRKLPPEWKAMIRQTLQAHCSSRPQYDGGRNIFVYHGRARWECLDRTASTEDL